MCVCVFYFCVLIECSRRENFAFDHIKEARGKEMALRTRRMLLFGTASGVSVSTGTTPARVVVKNY